MTDKLAMRGVTLRAPADNSRVITFRASTPAIDRHGTRILPTGLDTKEYDVNPIFAWAHDAMGGGIFGGPPAMEHVIGRTIAHRANARSFDIDVEFATEEVNPRADRAFRMVKAGFLSAVSIGFIPLKWEDEQEDSGRPIRTYTAARLLEVSLCAVPSNPECIALARAFYGDQTERRTFDLDELEAIMALDEAHKRAGAVLNKGNKSKLMEARSLIQQVLDTAATASADEQADVDEARAATADIPQDTRSDPAPDPQGACNDAAVTLQVVAEARAAEDDEEDDSPAGPGVYVARSLALADAKKLAAWAKDNGIAERLAPEDMHVTIVYSRAGYDPEPLDTDEMTVDIKGIKRLKDSIVLTLNAPKLVERHKAQREKGASHDFRSYQPHITLSNNGGASDLPESHPSMSVRLTGEFREDLDDDGKRIMKSQTPPAPVAADAGVSLAAIQAALRSEIARMAIKSALRA